MKAIYKYPIKNEEVQTLMLPKGAEILSIQVQSGSVVLYAIVNPDAEKEKRVFRCYITGDSVDYGRNDFDNELKYVGTYMLFNQQFVGHFVGHLFEEISKI